MYNRIPAIQGNKKLRFRQRIISEIQQTKYLDILANPVYDGHL